MLNQSLSQALLDRCNEVSGVFGSLAHPVRLKILCQLLDGDRGVNELTEFCGISQSAMSQFLNRMKAEKVVESRKQGTRVFYRIADAKLVSLLRSVKKIYCD
ncbi:MAG: winged helix-turn-helix transcriptional regulator [Bdellovibrionales bacterium]|nr:winged helix-turn-helix transcriptional regulator [Bdellovibrionales bacterium]